MSGRVKCTNDYFLKINKLKSHDQTVGMEVREFLETANNDKTITEKVIESGKAVFFPEVSGKFRVLDKPMIAVLSSAPIIDNSGAMMGVLTTVTDLTEMKKKEKEVQDLLDYANTSV